jgi:hypothetical protein
MKAGQEEAASKRANGFVRRRFRPHAQTLPARWEGPFKENADVGRSLVKDVRKKAKTKVKAGQSDRGDRAR